MDELRYTRIRLEQASPKTYYSEQEAAQYSHLDIEVIRQLREAKVVEGVEVVGEGRRYSEAEIALLRRIRRMHSDLDINLEGIEVILRLCRRLEALQQELDRYRGSH